MVLGRFNFRFRVEIGSTFSYVGSGLVSGHSILVNWIGSLLSGLLLCKCLSGRQRKCIRTLKNRGKGKSKLITIVSLLIFG